MSSSKLLTALLAFVLCLTLLVGCQSAPDSGDGPSTPSDGEMMQLDYLSVDVGNDDITEACLTESYMRQGNLARLMKVMNKAKNGEKVVIATFGGSITEGMSATQPQNNYSNRLLSWFKTTYPDGEFELVNAGIGATGSIIGGGRMEQDVLSKNPDLVIVEFAVNDSVSALELESYEGVVYRALTHENKPAVMLMFMCREDGGNAQTVQQTVGIKYDLPMISYRNCVVKGQKDGLYTWKDISPDIVHPNDRGHAIAASLLTHRLELVRQNLTVLNHQEQAVPETTSRFAVQNLKNSVNFTPTAAGAFQPATAQYYNHASLSNGWTAKAGDTESMVFTTTAKVVTLTFKRQVMNPGAKLQVKIGGTVAMTIDSNGGGSEYADLRVILDRQVDTPVEVELSLTADSPANSKFMLLGIIE